MYNYVKVIVSLFMTLAFAGVTANAKVMMTPTDVISNNIPLSVAISITVDKVTNIKCLIERINSKDPTVNSVVIINGFSFTVGQINSLNETLSGINNLVYDADLQILIISSLNGSVLLATNTVEFTSLNPQSQSLVLLAANIGELSGEVDKLLLFNFVISSLNGSAISTTNNSINFTSLNSQSQSLVLLAENIGKMDDKIDKTVLFGFIIAGLNGNVSVISSNTTAFNSLNSQSQSLVLLSESIGRLGDKTHNVSLFNFIISGLDGNTALIGSDMVKFNSLNSQSKSLVLLAESIGKLNTDNIKIALYTSILNAIECLTINLTITENMPITEYYKGITKLINNSVVSDKIIMPLSKLQNPDMVADFLLQIQMIAFKYSLKDIEIENFVRLIADTKLINNEVLVYPMVSNVNEIKNTEPFIVRFGGKVYLTDYKYVFIWADVNEVLPELTGKIVISSTYLGSKAKQLKECIKNNDMETAKALAKQYAIEWEYYNNNLKIINDRIHKLRK